MADVLLSHGYFLFEDEKELEIMKPYPPLGLLYLSAYLKRAGFSVEIFDTTFAKPAELAEKLQTESGGVLGLYTNMMTRKPILDIMDTAKNNGWTVVLGGPEAANYPNEYLGHGADVVVIGEGEETLSELLPALATHGSHDLHGVAGTVFRDAFGQLVTNPEREQIADIDSIPWPDREQIDMSRYIDVWREHHGMGSVNLITARGCPYKCHWCSHAVFGFTHRRRSYLDCADEIAHIRDVYKPDQVWYSDDVFTIHRTWLRNFASELNHRDLQLPFETISRADRMMHEEILETLAAMGCYRIWIGSESGSQRILNAMERGVTVDQVEWVTKTAQHHGIQVGMFLMWGYDGEEIEDIEATIEHVKRCNPDIFFTTVSYPIMNTAYYKEVADRVVRSGTWAESTDRDYRIQGRHSRAYYKYADQWLRNAVEAFRLESANPLVARAKRHEAQAAQRAMLTVAAEVEA